MNRDEAKRAINEHPERFFDRAKHGGYVCPLCGSGTHKNKTGFHYYKDSGRCSCFSCRTHGDVLDFIGYKYNLSSFNDKLRKGCEIYGIQYDNLISDNIPQIKKADDAPAPKKEPIKCEDVFKDGAEYTDQTDFFCDCEEHLTETDYLSKRGISIETAQQYHIGFCKEWRNPKAPTAPATPRLIIPTGPKSYIARDTRPDATDFLKLKYGNAHPFNLEALNQNAPCFICEGELDALSVIQLGFNAVGIGGTSNAQKIADYITAQKDTPRVILYLDEDDAGRNASDVIEQALKAQNKPYVKMIETGYKDANEYLCAFGDALYTDLKRAVDAFDVEAEQARQAYRETATNFYIEEFLNHIKESEDKDAIKTGFDLLDDTLDGGLYDGLYTIGAISSLGKTTFILQVGDQIAQQGKDVLIYSLEMSKDELMAKSISRLTASIDLEKTGLTSRAKTTRGILQGKLYRGYMQSEKDLITDAINLYRQSAKHLFIKEGNGATIEDIKNEIEKHYKATGNAPVVIIDYLQIITTADSRKSDKQAMDLNVSELKRISRDYKTPVIVISSFNRGNYSTPVDMESFKESGAIEYSSDVLIGLQLGDVFTGTNETDPEKHKSEIKKAVREAKAKTPRPVELVILKNRNGAIPKEPIKYKFYAKFNLFKEENPNAQQDYYRAKNGY